MPYSVEYDISNNQKHGQTSTTPSCKGNRQGKKITLIKKAKSHIAYDVTMTSQVGFLPEKSAFFPGMQSILLKSDFWRI